MEYLFLDTNVFLHYQRIDQINWAEEFEVDEVTIVVARVTLRELEHLKFNHRRQHMRERCQKTLVQLNNWLDNPANLSRPNLNIMYYQQPLKINFLENGLDKEWNDDVLIAYVLQFEQDNPTADVALVCDDSTLRRKAEGLGITVKEPDARFKLPPVLDDDQKEINNLKRELQKYKNSIPNLAIQFVVGSEASDRVTIAVPPTKKLDEQSLREQLAAAMRKFPKNLSPLRDPFSQNVSDQIDSALSRLLNIHHQMDLNKETIEYNKAVDQYYSKYKQYLEWKWKFDEVIRRRVQVNFTVNNSGNTPGIGLYIQLNFPPHLRVFDESSMPESPVEPQPPKLPYNTSTALMDSMIANINYDSLKDIATFRETEENVSELEIKCLDGCCVSLNIQKVVHNLPVVIPPLYLLFDNNHKDLSDFVITYKIIAENCPEVVNGSLSVRIENS